MRVDSDHGSHSLPDESDAATEDRSSSSLAAGETAWYAVYSQVNHEKEVAQRLLQKSVETFLPLQERWSKRRDRRKKLQVPLFPGYLFIHTVLDNYINLEVLKTPGVVWIIRNSAGPVSIPDQQIESLQRLLAQSPAITVVPYLRAGDLVRVRSGPFCGCVGFLVRQMASKGRLVVSLDIIQQSVSVEMDVEDVETVSPSGTILPGR